jgi:hypothetical protein
MANSPMDSANHDQERIRNLKSNPQLLHEDSKQDCLTMMNPFSSNANMHYEENFSPASLLASDFRMWNRRGIRSRQDVEDGKGAFSCEQAASRS